MERWAPAFLVHRRLHAERGVTLVEMLVCLALLGLLGALSASFSRLVLINLRLAEATVTTRTGVVLAVDAFVRELRLAGFSSDPSFLGFPAASATEVEIATDLNLDGFSNDPSERVAYRYSNARQAFGRATGNGGAQTIVSNVPPECVQLAYFDAAGTSLGSVGSPLSLAERKRIRRIHLRLCSEVDVGGVGTKVRTELALSVAPRNP